VRERTKLHEIEIFTSPKLLWPQTHGQYIHIPSNQITNWTKEWTVDGVRVEVGVGARTVLIAF